MLRVPGAFGAKRYRTDSVCPAGRKRGVPMSMTATAQWAAFPSHSAEIASVREEFITAYGYEPDGVW